MKELLTIIADIGLGASALYLASKQTVKVNQVDKRQDSLDARVTVLERKAA
jgi:chaperonin cofactor prefoldin